MSKTPPLTLDADRELIRHLGGPAQLARMMGLTSRHSVQRVHNWTQRGIPPAVKLQYPEIFLAPRLLKQAAQKAEATHGR